MKNIILYESIRSVALLIAFTAVVAYGYNEEKDWFYVHLGYSPALTLMQKL